MGRSFSTKDLKELIQFHNATMEETAHFTKNSDEFVHKAKSLFHNYWKVGGKYNISC